MAREVIRKGSRRNVAGILFTVALHGGVLLAVARAHNQPEPPLIMPHDFVRAELVKLGKPRIHSGFPGSPSRRSRRRHPTS